MKKYIASILILLSASTFATIRIASVNSSTSDLANSILENIDAMLYSDSTIDLILGPSEGMGGDSNKARVIFADSAGTIQISAADTFYRSREICVIIEGLCHLAEIYNTVILPGTVWEVDSNYRCFESMPIIGSDGNIQRVRRKSHKLRTDMHIDSQIRLDTIITRDSSEYTYLITISNETRTLAPLYGTLEETADIWLLSSRRWAEDFEIIADQVQTESPPNWLYINTIFPTDYLITLYDSNWISTTTPVIVSTPGENSGATWTLDILSDGSELSEWYIYPEYQETPEGFVVSFNPDSLSHRFQKDYVVYAHDTSGMPVNSLQAYYYSLSMDTLGSRITNDLGYLTIPLCGPDSFIIIFRFGDALISPKDTTLYISSFEPETLDIVVTIDTTGISDNLPEHISFSAYPNPFNTQCKISAPGAVTIYDIEGKFIRHLENSGKNSLNTVWDGRNSLGKEVSSGIYFAYCNRADKRLIRLILLK